MPNKIDFLGLQAKLNLTSFWRSLVELPSFITFNLSKNDFTTLYTAHVMFIPTPCTQILQYIYIIDSLGCKIKLPVVYNGADGFVFYIDDSIFNVLPSNFNVICVYDVQTPTDDLITFNIFGDSQNLSAHDPHDLFLNVPSNFPTKIPVVWTASSLIDIDFNPIYTSQLKVRVVPHKNGMITASAVILGYCMYAEISLTLK